MMGNESLRYGIGTGTFFFSFLLYPLKNIVETIHKVQGLPYWFDILWNSGWPSDVQVRFSLKVFLKS